MNGSTTPRGRSLSGRTLSIGSTGSFGFSSYDDFNTSEKPAYGYRVIGVAKDSPVEKCNLIPWFDFIVKAGDTELMCEDREEFKEDTFKEIVQMCVNKPLGLTVYNVKCKKLRKILFTPKNWKGAGLTGLQVAYCAFTDAIKHVVHVIDVQSESPAASAGLQAHSDYLLGTTDGIAFSHSAVLVSAIRESLYKPLDMFVYSSCADTVRVARIIPSDKWNGEGVIGCDIGIGVAHRLPEMCRDTLGAFRPLGLKSSLVNRDSDIMDGICMESDMVNETPPQFVRHEIVSNLGMGQILGKDSTGGVCCLLDWRLPPGCAVVAFLKPESYVKLPSLAS